MITAINHHFVTRDKIARPARQQQDRSDQFTRLAKPFQGSLSHNTFIHHLRRSL